MAKPYEIKLKVEEIALGSVLRKLHEMPGISSVDLNLGLGGTGAGVEKLAEAAKLKSGTVIEKVARLLHANGPMFRGDIAKQVGSAMSTISSTLFTMKARGIVVAVGRGVYRLNGAPLPAAPLALPAPPATPRTANGHLHHGAGPAVLLLLLLPAPLARREVGERLRGMGLDTKSIQGLLYRSTHNKLIKRNGKGKDAMLALTAKGRAEAEASHHG